MIIEITEAVYKGILVERVENKGWKCNLGGHEYLFPHYTAAQTAIDEIFRDTKPVVTKNKGVKLKTPSEALESIPLCKNCERIANITATFNNHLKLDDEYSNAIMRILETQKEAFQEKDYLEAEAILDTLIEEMQE